MTTPDKIKVRIAVIAWREAGEDGAIHYDASGWSTDASDPRSQGIDTDEDLAAFARRARDGYGDAGDSWGEPYIIEAEIDAPPPPVASRIIKGEVVK